MPTIFFDCQSGWDATNKVWATSAPDGEHSPLVGWSIDGLPVYGPFSDGGEVPTDLNGCYAHSHGDIGWHYHGNFEGETQDAFIGCYQAARAAQEWDIGSTVPPDDVPDPNGVVGVICPATTYTTSHSIVDTQAAYMATPPAFSSKTCVDVDRVLS